MKKWKLVAGVLLVFAFGILIGVLGSGFYHHYLSDRFRKDPAEKKAFILKKLNKIREESYLEMKKVLNPDQQNTFDELIKEIRDRYKFTSLTNRKKN
jgi:hypothetical protein